MLPQQQESWWPSWLLPALWEAGERRSCDAFGKGQRVALVTAAGRSLLQPPPCFRGVVTEYGAWEEKSVLSLHVRVISFSMTLGKATCETAFTSHWKKARLPKFCLFWVSKKCWNLESLFALRKIPVPQTLDLVHSSILILIHYTFVCVCVCVKIL